MCETPNPINFLFPNLPLYNDISHSTLHTIGYQGDIDEKHFLVGLAFSNNIPQISWNIYEGLSSVHIRCMCIN